jgi:hypothetical protein
LFYSSQMATKKTKKTSAQKRYKTVPIPDTITPVPGYPNKLVIYKSSSSPYWYARYFVGGKTVKKSTRTEGKAEALKFAKELYDTLNYRKQQGLAIGSAGRFETVVNTIYVDQQAQITRGQLSPITHESYKYRFNKHIIPYFKDIELERINYLVLQNFLNYLSTLPEQLRVSTIRLYMHQVKKVLIYAQRSELITHMPQFPKVGVKDNPRGYFTTREYRALCRRAKALIGKEFEVRKVANDAADAVEPEITVYQQLGKTDAGRQIRKTLMTRDLYELIVFMTNSFIRPTDIKNLKHKHVDVLDDNHTYLRLNLPPSKKHDKPIVTMSKAVEVYLRHKKYYRQQELIEQQQNKELAAAAAAKLAKQRQQASKRMAKHGLVMPTLTQREAKQLKKQENLSKKSSKRLPTLAAQENYVFLPQYHSNRDYALKQLQRQFDILLWSTGLRNNVQGEDRSLYSLRHTCIMYRLMFGEGMDLLTLARNARTSTEMIDRFYASKLKGEDNIEMLQSRRRRTETKASAKSFKLTELLNEMRDGKI